MHLNDWAWLGFLIVITLGAAYAIYERVKNNWLQYGAIEQYPAIGQARTLRKDRAARRWRD